MRASVLTLALLFAGAAYAQTQTTAPTREAHHMDNLATLLDLTEAQKAQVQAILQEEHAKMKASFEQARASGSKPDFEQMRALHEQVKQETLQKLTPVLSPAQLKKFQIIAEEMHHHHGHFGHGAPGAAGAPPPSG
jgi:LTXXQ motif family protein